MEKLNLVSELPGRADGLGRRSFLRYAGGVAVIGSVLASCATPDEIVSKTPSSDLSKYAGARLGKGKTVNLGSGELGILNYAYALEQLEAAFYEEVMEQQYEGMTARERHIFRDLRAHEQIHRDFFKAALDGAAIPKLTFNFSGINFKQRSVVIDVARQFEDTGVSAYNGAGKFLQTEAYLITAGKIVSVEARHASVLSELQFPHGNAFAGDSPIDGNGLERSLNPGAVLAKVAPFIEETIISGLMA